MGGALKSPEALELAPQLRENLMRADAAAGGLFGVCGLLMRLRNLYKWERGIPPWHEPEPDKVLAWVHEREDAWAEREGLKPEPLTIKSRGYDPFDADAVNKALDGKNLVYGAGMAGRDATVFFLGAKAGQSGINGLKVITLGEEAGRDILFLPGLRHGDTIILRKEPFAFLLWDKISDPRASVRRYVRFGLKAYDVEPTPFLKKPDPAVFESLAEKELRTVLWHELGEAGPGDQAVGLLRLALNRHPMSEVEHFVRGVKDLLADTGPGGRLDMIIKARAAGSLGFYPLWLGGFSRLLFPEADAAIMEFIHNRDWAEVEEARRIGWQRALTATRRLGALLDLKDAVKAARLVRDEVITPLTGGRS